MYQKKMDWPLQKKAAAMISIELDNEFIWLGMDPANAARPKTLSMGTYGTTRGLERVLRVLNEKEVKATFFVLGIFAEKYPDSLSQIIENGHEIALHGWQHKDFSLMDLNEQKAEIEKGLEALEKASKRRPVGIRLPEGGITSDTIPLIESMGFLYDSSLLDFDLPYFHNGDKKEGASGLVEIPINYELQDFINFAFNFFPPFPLGVDSPAIYRDVLSNWRREVSAYERHGACCVCRFDPQSIGTPGRITLLEELIDDILQKDIWLATGREIAEYFCSQNSI